MLEFFTHTFEAPGTKLNEDPPSSAGQPARVRLELGEHCSLGALHRGTLTVSVGYSSHLYQLKKAVLSERFLGSNEVACKSAAGHAARSGSSGAVVL